MVGGGDVTDGLIGGVTHYSLAGARMATVTEALAAIDSRIGAGAATPNHVLSVSPVHLCPATEPEAVPADAAPMPGVGLVLGVGPVPGARPDPGLSLSSGYVVGTSRVG